MVVTFDYGVPRSYTVLEVLPEDQNAACVFVCVLVCVCCSCRSTVVFALSCGWCRTVKFDRNGTSVSVAEYMKERYGLTLPRQDLMDPLLLVTQSCVMHTPLLLAACWLRCAVAVSTALRSCGCVACVLPQQREVWRPEARQGVRTPHPPRAQPVPHL